MTPLVIAFLLSFLNPSYSKLTSGSFFSFHSNEFFYILDSDSVFVTKNGKSYKKRAHKMNWLNWVYLVSYDYLIDGFSSSVFNPLKCPLERQ